MRHYEIVILIHPDQSEQVTAMVERYRGIIDSKSGIVHRYEDWGRRQLAFIIDDIHKAHYVMLNIECDLETLRELENTFKFNDAIIRTLIIKRKAALTETSVMAKAVAEEAETEKRRAEERAVRATEEEASAAAREARAEEEGHDEIIVTADDIDMDEVAQVLAGEEEEPLGSDEIESDYTEQEEKL